MKVLLFTSHMELKLLSNLNFFFFHSIHEETLYPLCNPQGCTCADGFELIETVQSKICRPLEKEVEVDAKCMWLKATNSFEYR